jgi:peptidoglycan/xylan/chitin deacetylase (PgdA/CDA1 family)
MNRTLIFTYHRMGLPPPGARYRRLYTSPPVFAWQLRVLRAAGYTFSTLTHAIESPGGRLACFTFDDGCESVREVALPALQAYGAAGTVFVVTADAGQRGIRWKESKDQVPVDLLSWASLHQMSRNSGWEIGSHGDEHLHLARLPREAQVASLERSFAALSSQIGSPPASVAYPHGSWDTVTTWAAREAGFRCGVTTVRGAVRRSADRFALPRVPAGGYRLRHRLSFLRALFA